MLTQNEIFIAPIKERILAAILDVFIVLIIFSFLYLLIFLQHETFEGESGAGFAYGVSISKLIYLKIFIFWLLFITVTEYKNGQSIGKRIFKIKVVKQDLTEPTFRDIFVRHLFDIVDLILFVGLIIALNNHKTQRIGDLIVKTIVLKK